MCVLGFRVVVVVVAVATAAAGLLSGMGRFGGSHRYELGLGFRV